MLGLPVPGRGLEEAKAIIGFFERLGSRSRLRINLNVGTFVPKPHTPFQWSAQLREDEALEAINFLRSGLRKFRNIKLSYHSPIVSKLEGIIARGDERVGELILAAFKRGARLDAWDERFDSEVWRSVIDEADWPVVDECFSEKHCDSCLPWDDINIGVSKAAFCREKERSSRCETTSGCMENCTNPCGVCGPECRIVDETIQSDVVGRDTGLASVIGPKKPVGRLVFKYSKMKTASYLQHLSIIDAFDRAFLISGIDMAYSEGFNPMPRFETAQPIPIAVQSSCEIASLLLCSEVEPKAIITAINTNLPSGLRIEEAAYYPLREGRKQRTIGSLEWGSEYYIYASSSDASTLLIAIQNVISSRSIPNAIVEYIPDTDGHIRLRLGLPTNKDHGLIRILEASTDCRPIQSALKITRTELYADAGDGVPRSFFDAYSIVS
jgi:hypothetical protein